MGLPPPSAYYRQRVRYGRYVERRLRRAKRAALADNIKAATDEILALGRAQEDTNDAVQGALADRDAADDDLDDAAQNGRAALAGRSADAIKKAPYTLIFPEGVGYYTAATLLQEVARYGELKKRMEENLPASDEVRKATVEAIDVGVVAFTTGVEMLGKARTEEALAKTRLDAAEEAWDRLMTKTYGVLIGEMSRAAADRFFPKPKSVKSADDAANE